MVKFIIVGVALVGLGIYFALQLSKARTQAEEVKQTVESVAADANRTATQAYTKAQKVYDAATK